MVNPHFDHSVYRGAASSTLVTLLVAQDATHRPTASDTSLTPMPAVRGWGKEMLESYLGNGRVKAAREREDAEETL